MFSKVPTRCVLAGLAARDVPYVPAGQFQQVRACRAALQGVIESPVPFSWSIRKAP